MARRKPWIKPKPLKIADDRNWTTKQRIFNDFYNLLDLVASNTGDTLWAMPEGAAVHVTAQDALIELALKYDQRIASQLAQRLGSDSDLREE
jgi:hypothetical protein